MNKAQRVIASLLTIACVLLTVNILMSGTRAAMAQGPSGPDAVVGGQVVIVGDEESDRPTYNVFRFWSSGSVDHNLIKFTDDCRPRFLCGREVVAAP